MEKKTKYKIKAEREYLRSHFRGELGVKVQTSNLSDVTADEAIANVTIEEAFVTGALDTGILQGIENASEYEADIRIISIMKDDFELVEECVEDMDDVDSRLMKGFLVQRKYIKELACDFNLSYDTVKRRIRRKEMASRKDSKGYALRTGESQRSDGRYCFSYQDRRGKRHYRYAKTLVALRDIEKQVRRDMEDGIDAAHADKITVNEMYDKYISQKYNLKPSTRNNYKYCYDHFIRETFGKKHL